MQTATAYIDLAALQHNLQRVRELVPNHPVMVMVKANAYGHGLIESARALSHADAFGVARLPEALALREAGFTQRIVLLEGFFDRQELELAAQHQLDSVVHQNWQVRLLQQAKLSRQIKVWVKADTGMHRIGFAPEQVSAVFDDLANCCSVNPSIQLMTHFACADDLSSSETAQQLQCFKKLLPVLQKCNSGGEPSIANSAAILSHPEAHLGWLRPGIMLYGASPMIGGRAKDHDLRPVMTLISKVIAIRDLDAGQAVGYGATWVSETATRIAVVAIGYGDGYPRHATNGTPVWINGRTYPIAGRVSMDMVTVNIKDADIKVGDKVELWGKNLSADVVARHAGTISYELFCGLSSRVSREFA